VGDDHDADGGERSPEKTADFIHETRSPSFPDSLSPPTIPWENFSLFFPGSPYIFELQGGFLPPRRPKGVFPGGLILYQPPEFISLFCCFGNLDIFFAGSIAASFVPFRAAVSAGSPSHPGLSPEAGERERK
jgi:hypothetical protein